MKNYTVSFIKSNCSCGLVLSKACHPNETLDCIKDGRSLCDITHWFVDCCFEASSLGFDRSHFDCLETGCERDWLRRWSGEEPRGGSLWPTHMLTCQETDARGCAKLVQVGPNEVSFFKLR